MENGVFYSTKHAYSNVCKRISSRILCNGISFDDFKALCFNMDAQMVSDLISTLVDKKLPQSTFTAIQWSCATATAAAAALV